MSYSTTRYDQTSTTPCKAFYSSNGEDIRIGAEECRNKLNSNMYTWSLPYQVGGYQSTIAAVASSTDSSSVQDEIAKTLHYMNTPCAPLEDNKYFFIQGTSIFDAGDIKYLRCNKLDNNFRENSCSWVDEMDQYWSKNLVSKWYNFYATDLKDGIEIGKLDRVHCHYSEGEVHLIDTNTDHCGSGTWEMHNFGNFELLCNHNTPHLNCFNSFSGSVARGSNSITMKTIPVNGIRRNFDTKELEVCTPKR
mmetsp:Transcript_12805/g.23075  ORF Transcript_12805/g.23075 Transcript_12805/m.23075 type:complete len:249 (-) Transcript_12805:56-802(-)